MAPHGRDSDRKAQLRGRRGFIKLLTSLGVSASTAANISQGALAEMDASLENEVPYVARKVHATDKPIEPGTPLKREAEYEAKSREQWEKIEAAIGASREINKRIENTFSNTNGLVSPWVATLSDGTLAISVEYTVQERPKPRRDHQERSRDHQRSENGSRASGASERETIIKRPGPSFKKVEQALPGKAQGRVPHRLRGADKVSASAFEDKKIPSGI